MVRNFLISPIFLVLAMLTLFFLFGCTSGPSMIVIKKSDLNGLTFPTLDANKFLSNDGNVLLWKAVTGGSSTDTNTQTAGWTNSSGARLIDLNMNTHNVKDVNSLEIIGSAIIAGTGGTITHDGLYTVHTFITNGTFTPPSTIDVNVLVVAGGGGGNQIGSGGGAGGLIFQANKTVSAPVTVTVGAGGIPDNAGATIRNGGNSVFMDLNAVGGGGSAFYAGGITGAVGGSGSGGSSDPVGTAGGAGTTGQGHNGGSGYTRSGSYVLSGGGGGAGAVGANATSTTGGNGGNGLAYNITGSTIYYAGGGGGSIYASGTAGVGGLGGGGNGAKSGITGSAGVNGLGGGAGGLGTNYGTTGGSGVVIVRYLTPTIATITTGRITEASNLFVFSLGGSFPSINATSGTITTLNSTTFNATTSNATNFYQNSHPVCDSSGAGCPTGSNPFNQSLNTSDTPQFNGLYASQIYSSNDGAAWAYYDDSGNLCLGDYSGNYYGTTFCIDASNGHFIVDGQTALEGRCALGTFPNFAHGIAVSCS